MTPLTYRTCARLGFDHAPGHGRADLHAGGDEVGLEPQVLVGSAGGERGDLVAGVAARERQLGSSCGEFGEFLALDTVDARDHEVVHAQVAVRPCQASAAVRRHGSAVPRLFDRHGPRGSSAREDGAASAGRAADQGEGAALLGLGVHGEVFGVEGFVLTPGGREGVQDDLSADVAGALPVLGVPVPMSTSAPVDGFSGGFAETSPR